MEDPAQSEFDALELPSMTPASLARKFGPGMMLMMTGIGTSHLVTAPVTVPYGTSGPREIV